jgi:hypothetical protein
VKKLELGRTAFGAELDAVPKKQLVFEVDRGGKL